MFFASAALLACHAKGADLPSQQQAAPAKPAPPAANPCFASLYDFVIADPDDCPLAWNGIRLYGRFDYGAGYDSHGVPFNGNYPNGVETLISKNSNGARFTLVPNGLGQTHVGIKGEEHIVSDWSFVFKFENGFDPYTLQRANGPKSLVENNTTPLDAQTANGDSSRAGQLFNTEAYIGFSNPTYGELLAGRQNSLIVDGASRFDPMGAASSLFRDRRFQYRRRRRRHRDRALQHVAQISHWRRAISFRGALSVRRLRPGQRLERRIFARDDGRLRPSHFRRWRGRGTKTRSRYPISLNFPFLLE